jgi:hypothetical protein
MANTVFKVENGLDVVGSANVSGSLSVGGEFNITGNVTFSGTSNGDFKPINNNYSLGDADQRWGLSATTIDVSGTSTLSNTLTVAGQSTFSANVIPNSNNVQLGDTTKRWDLYANNANVLTFSVNVGTAANLNVSNTATVNGTLIVNPGLANAFVVSGNSTHSNVTLSGNVSNFGGNSNFDSGVLFVDATNNRVGFNNTTPDATVTVTGTANVSANVTFGGFIRVGSQDIINSSGNWVGPSSGVQGVQGAQGVQGVLGAQGFQGIQGSQGVQGATGAQGVLGAQGSQGIQGAQGVQGSGGATGAQGGVGAQGFQGVQGATGAQGPQGSTGSQGAQGAGLSSTETPRVNSLGVNTTAGAQGEIRATDNITAYYSSDERLKTNTIRIEDALAKVLALNGITFDWTDEYIKSKGGEDGFFIRKQDVGVIAQQVQKVLPQIVAERKDGYLAVQYEKLVALLIESTKDLEHKYNEIDRRVSTLEKKKE